MTPNLLVTGLFLAHSNLPLECICLYPGLREPVSTVLACYNLVRIIANLAHRVFIELTQSSPEKTGIKAASVTENNNARARHVLDLYIHMIRCLPGIGPVFGIGRLFAGMIVELTQNAQAQGPQAALPANPIPPA